MIYVQRPSAMRQTAVSHLVKRPSAIRQTAVVPSSFKPRGMITKPHAPMKWGFMLIPSAPPSQTCWLPWVQTGGYHRG